MSQSNPQHPLRKKKKSPHSIETTIGVFDYVQHGGGRRQEMAANGANGRPEERCRWQMDRA